MNYIDRDGNIAYWMSGWDPIRTRTSTRCFPSQTGLSPEWTGELTASRHTIATTRRGWYGGWNNKASVDYNNGTTNYNYYFGPCHRAHVVDEYLSATTI